MTRFQEWLSFDPENKTQSISNVSAKPAMSPGNDHDTIMTQNSEPVWSKRKEKETTTSEDKKAIFILGDSMVKHVEGWKLSKNIDRKHKVYDRSFSSTKVKCMKDYVKPCIRENNPDHVLIHVGTNELDSKRQAVILAKSIKDVAKSIKTKEQTPVQPVYQG